MVTHAANDKSEKKKYVTVTMQGTILNTKPTGIQVEAEGSKKWYNFSQYSKKITADDIAALAVGMQIEMVVNKPENDNGKSGGFIDSFRVIGADMSAEAGYGQDMPTDTGYSDNGYGYDSGYESYGPNASEVKIPNDQGFNPNDLSPEAVAIMNTMAKINESLDSLRNEIASLRSSVGRSVMTDEELAESALRQATALMKEAMNGFSDRYRNAPEMIADIKKSIIPAIEELTGKFYSFMKYDIQKLVPDEEISQGRSMK